jgi:hypothetical protein
MEEKQKTKRKTFRIVIISLLMLVLVLFMIDYVRWGNFLIDISYIDIAEDLRGIPDWVGESSGIGIHKYYYTGQKPTHYVIMRNGDVYKIEKSSIKHAMSGFRPSASINKITKITKEELVALEQNLYDTRDEELTSSTKIEQKNKYDLILEDGFPNWVIKIKNQKFYLKSLPESAQNIISKKNNE